MTITLHAATEELRALLDLVDENTGELPLGLELARQVVEQKAVAVVAYMLESERQADMAEGYVKELQQRIKSQRKRVEWLRTYLADHMRATGITKITDERGIFSAKLEIGRDKSVEVFDEDQVPADYMREMPATSEPDKKLIRSALDDGFDVPGARVIARDRLTVK